MQIKLKKKVIGSVIYLGVLALVALGIAGPVYARFIRSGGSLIIDGVIVNMTSSSMTIDTSGSDVVVVGIDSRTVFPKHKVLGDFEVGDVVSITARTQTPNPIASVIREREDGEYGFPGDPVMVRRGTVIAKGNSWFTIATDITTITFKVTSSTVFTRTSFPFLKIGNVVQVTGKDTGNGFVAKVVIQR